MNSEEDLELVMETKLRENLKWSMIFFVFNFVVSEIEKKHKDSESDKYSKDITKQFFRNWKKYATENLVKKDLETINSILNSPKNIFYSTLQNSGDIIESTELYQEKYNNIFKLVENFYSENTSFKNKNE